MWQVARCLSHERAPQERETLDHPDTHTRGVCERVRDVLDQLEQWTSDGKRVAVAPVWYP
jgi:hypothetical protein